MVASRKSYFASMESISFSLFLLFLCTTFTVSITQNTESIKHHEGKWKKYLSVIEESLASYKECNDSDCSCHEDVMNSDFSAWAEIGITKELFDRAKQSQATQYQIIQHKLYRQTDCMFAFRCSGIEHFILEIISDLPDMELAINVHDYPLSPKFGPRLPIFSFSKVLVENWDIMYPAWTFWEGGPAVWPIYPTGLGRWDLQRDIISKVAKKWAWSKKHKKGFFRGSRTNDQRDPLVLLSRAEPDLVDAQYTKNQAWKSDKDTLYQPPASEIKLEDHCPYKYLFNFRGVAASFRLKHLFLCRSLVFHVGNDWLEFFYPALKPWVHYIPVKSDLSDAKELLKFARDNDKIAKEIAERGYNFIWSHLRIEDVSCYWKNLLQKYAAMLRFKPKRNKEFKEILPQKKKDEL